MRIRVSTKGQVVLPQQLRESLGLRPGDFLETKIKGEQIILTPAKPRSRRVRLSKNPLTGLPVLTAGTNAPQLNSKRVKKILAEFP